MQPATNFSGTGSQTLTFSGTLGTPVTLSGTGTYLWVRVYTYNASATATITPIFTLTNINLVGGPTNPTPQALPYFNATTPLSFGVNSTGSGGWTSTTSGTNSATGTVNFASPSTAAANGWAFWAQGITTVSTQALAAKTNPPADWTVTGVADGGTINSTSGLYGSGKSTTPYTRLLDMVVTANATKGGTQPVLAINTTNLTGITVGFTLAVPYVSSSTNSGVELEARVGTSGAWTPLIPSTPSTGYTTGAIPAGAVLAATNFVYTLPQAFENQSNVQIRWADWLVGTGYNITLNNIYVTNTGTFATAPTAQPTSAAFTSIGTTGFTANWTNGTGTGTNSLVVVYPHSPTPTTPSGTYTANAAYTSGSAIGTGYVVYNGTGNSVTVTGLSPSTTYDVYVYSFNGTSSYYTTSPLVMTQATSAAAVSAPSAFSATTSSTSQINLAATAAGSTGVVVYYNTSGTFTDPTNGNAASTVISGQTIAYNGAVGSITNLTGLSPNTKYYFAAYAYDGIPNYSLKATANATTNPLSPTTSSISPSTTPQLSSGSYSVVVTGTNFYSGVSAVTVNGSTTGVTTTFNSSTQLTASITYSTISGGSATIGVTNTNAASVSGTQTLTISLPTPTVTSFTPTSGGAGTSVTITGTGFSGITSVTVGGVAVTSYTVTSTTSITATIPAGVSAGGVFVVSNGSTGTSASNFLINFYYSGSGSLTTISNWGQNSAGNDGNTPASGLTGAYSNFYIINGPATVDANWTLANTSNLYIGDGTVTTAASIASNMTLTSGTGSVVTISANATLLISGKYVNQSATAPLLNGIVTVDASGWFQNKTSLTIPTATVSTFIVNGTYEHGVTNGSSGSTIPIGTWNVGSTCLVTGAYTSSTSASLVRAQTFYNFTWSSTGQTSSFSLGLANFNILGTLTVTSTGNTYLVLTATGVTDFASGNYVQTGGTVYISSTSSTNTRTFTTKNFSISGSSSYFEISNSASYPGYLYVTGDITFAGGHFGNNLTSGLAYVEFKGTNQTYNSDGTTDFTHTTSGTTAAGLTYTVDAGTSLTIASGTLSITCLLYTSDAADE